MEKQKIKKQKPLRITKLFIAISLLVAIFFGSNSLAFADTKLNESVQSGTRKLSGRVADVTGEPLIGVSVKIVGQGTGTVTDIDGVYELQAKTGGKITLNFSYIGFKPVQVEVGSKNIYDVILNEDINELDELVVVGYGQQRRISNIASQSTLKTEDIKTPSSSLSTVLAGRLSGVVAVQRSGEPGRDGADIWIRGISTPNASNPLVLVDGVERSFNDIDPEDIESLTTLKDASATAVYGVRGANGVILIKTKPGVVGKPTVSIDYYETFSRFTKSVDLADGITYMNAANDALRNDGLAPLYNDQYIENTRLGYDPYLYPNVNWMKEVFNDWGHNRRVNANVRGGTPNVRYYASVSYYGEDGMTKVDKNQNFNSDLSYKRYNFTTNLNLDVTSTTTVDIGAQGYLGEGNYPAYSLSDIYGTAMDASPVAYPKMFYIDGKPYVPGIDRMGNYQNPYAAATRMGYSNETKNQVYSNLRITQDLKMLTEGLKLSGMFAYDVYNQVLLTQSRRESTYYFKDRNVPYDYDGRPILEQRLVGSDALGYSQKSDGNNKKSYLEASLTYDRAFGMHRVGALVLYNQQDRRQYPVGRLEESIPYRMQGLAGRATYSFNDRYFAEFNVGYNGSENFAPNKRYGVFPAFGAGWAISNEKFWQPFSNTVSFLRLRYTNGKIGNSVVTGARFMYLDQIGYDGGWGYTWGSPSGGSDGIVIYNNASQVGWETSHKQDLGIDIKMFNNDLSIIFDLFKERRSNILLRRDASIPGFLGYTSDPYGNVGIVDNKGFDGSVEYTKAIDENWVVAVRGNVTYNENKWIESDQPEQAYPWMNQRGASITGRRGFTATGLYTQAEIDDIKRWESLTDADKQNTARPFPVQFGEVSAGDIKYLDLNKDGKIDENDKSYIGHGDVPKLIYGFGGNIDYKAFSLGFLFQGISQADRMLSGKSINPFRGDAGGGNLFSNIEDRWTQEDPSQDVFYPRLGYGDASNINNFQESTWWQKDVSFLRLKTLQLSYRLPKYFATRMLLRNATVYMMATNLFTLSDFNLWDPELNTNNGTKYPNISSYSLGINFTF